MSWKLCVGNLPVSATEADLRSKFARYGTVESVTLVTDVRSGRSRRFGFVEMASDSAAKMAINWLNMTQYDDVTMSVTAAPIGK